jgi:hypothetical protein
LYGADKAPVKQNLRARRAGARYRELRQVSGDLGRRSAPDLARHPPGASASAPASVGTIVAFGRLSITRSVEQAHRPRRRPGGQGLRPFGRYAEVGEDLPDDRRVFDGGKEAQPPTAFGTGENVNFERAAQKVRPRRVRPRL